MISTVNTSTRNGFSLIPLAALLLTTLALAIWPVFTARGIEFSLIDLPLLVSAIWFGTRTGVVFTVLAAAVGWLVWGQTEWFAWLAVFSNALLLLSVIAIVRQRRPELSTAVCGLGYWVLIGAPATYLIFAAGFGDTEVAAVAVGQRVLSGICALVAANLLHFSTLIWQERLPKAWLGRGEYIHFSFREAAETAALIAAATPALLLLWYLVTEQLEEEISRLFAQSDARFETLAQGATQSLLDLDASAELLALSLSTSSGASDGDLARLESSMREDLNIGSALGIYAFEAGALTYASPGIASLETAITERLSDESQSEERLLPLSSEDDGPTLYQLGIENEARLGIVFSDPLQLWEFVYGRGLMGAASTFSGTGSLDRVSHFHGPSAHELFGIDASASIVRREYDYAIWIPGARDDYRDHQFRKVGQFRNSYITFMASDPLIANFDAKLFDIDCFRFTTDFWTHMSPTLTIMSMWIVGGSAALFLLALLIGQVVNFLTSPFSQLTAAMSHLSSIDDSETFQKFRFQRSGGADEFIALREGFSRMERALHNSSQRIRGINRDYEDLLNQVGVGFMSIDGRGESLFANPVMQQLLGRFPDLQQLTEALNPRDKTPMEPITLTNPDRQRLEALVHAVPRIDLAGKQDGAWILLTDVTSIKETEAQLVQAQKFATLGQMATGMAHEINQPLQTIRLSLANLGRLLNAKNPDFAVVKEKATMVDKQVSRIAALVQHMKSYGRAESAEWQAFSPDLCIEALVEIWLAGYKADGVQLHCDLTAGESALVGGNSNQFEQVIMNLLQNAKDAYSDDVTSRAIWVQSRCLDNRYELSVTDKAGGFEESVLEHIFEPFFTTKAPNRGTGLGLSVTFGIIDEMGGTIMADNFDGGARFRITLPLHE